VRATGTSTGRRIAARFSIFAVTRRCVLAAAGLAIFPVAAALAIFRAHLAILAFAAVHGRLVAFVVVFAACHRRAVFAFAAIRGAIFAVATRLAGATLMILMFAAGTRFRIGRSRGWRPAGLLRNGRQPRGQCQNQYHRNHSQFHFFTLFAFFGADVGIASHAVSDLSELQEGRVSESKNGEFGTKSGRRAGRESLEIHPPLTGGNHIQRRYERNTDKLRLRQQSWRQSWPVFR